MATSTSGSPQDQGLFEKANVFNNDAIKSCAAAAGMAGMYWPSGLDSSYYSSANALAAAVTSMTASMNGGNTTTVGATSTTTPVTPTGLSDALSATFGYPQMGGAMNPASVFAASGVTRTFAHSTTPTPKKKATPVPTHMKDDSYWDRRKKNNESARRSREARRMKEEQIAIRVVYLEQENLQLKTECQMLKMQIDKLTMMLYGTQATGATQQR